jgi:hypothetical protein
MIGNYHFAVVLVSVSGVPFLGLKFCFKMKENQRVLGQVSYVDFGCFWVKCQVCLKESNLCLGEWSKNTLFDLA